MVFNAAAYEKVFPRKPAEPAQPVKAQVKQESVFDDADKVTKKDPEPVHQDPDPEDPEGGEPDGD